MKEILLKMYIQCTITFRFQYKTTTYFKICYRFPPRNWQTLLFIRIQSLAPIQNNKIMFSLVCLKIAVKYSFFSVDSYYDITSANETRYIIRHNI